MDNVLKESLIFSSSKINQVQTSNGMWRVESESISKGGLIY